MHSIDGVTLTYILLLLLPFVIAAILVGHAIRLRKAPPLSAYPREDEEKHRSGNRS